MPGKGNLPKLVEVWAGEIVKEKHKKKSDAIAIAIAQAQKNGYLKKHTLKLTEKGRKASRKYYGKKLPKRL